MAVLAVVQIAVPLVVCRCAWVPEQIACFAMLLIVYCLRLNERRNNLLQ